MKTSQKNPNSLLPNWLHATFPSNTQARHQYAHTGQLSALASPISKWLAAEGSLNPFIWSSSPCFNGTPFPPHWQFSFALISPLSLLPLLCPNLTHVISLCLVSGVDFPFSSRQTFLFHLNLHVFISSYLKSPLVTLKGTKNVLARESSAVKSTYTYSRKWVQFVPTTYIW